MHARACWILRDHEALRSLDAELERAGNAFEWTAAPNNRALVKAFVALIDGRLADSQALLEPLANDINRSLFYPATQARLMLADVQLQRGQMDAAASSLRPWFEDVHAGLEIGGALLAGPQVLGRLQSAPWGGRLDADDVALLSRLAGMLAPGRSRRRRSNQQGSLGLASARLRCLRASPPATATS